VTGISRFTPPWHDNKLTVSTDRFSLVTLVIFSSGCSVMATATKSFSQDTDLNTEYRSVCSGQIWLRIPLPEVKEFE